MNLKQAASALATAITGVGIEPPLPRGSQESLQSSSARKLAHARRMEIEAALVAFGEACVAKAQRHET